jgi:hypothetical protein
MRTLSSNEANYIGDHLLGFHRIPKFSTCKTGTDVYLIGSRCSNLYAHLVVEIVEVWESEVSQAARHAKRSFFSVALDVIASNVSRVFVLSVTAISTRVFTHATQPLLLIMYSPVRTALAADSPDSRRENFES